MPAWRDPGGDARGAPRTARPSLARWHLRCSVGSWAVGRALPCVPASNLLHPLSSNSKSSGLRIEKGFLEYYIPRALTSISRVQLFTWKLTSDSTLPGCVAEAAHTLLRRTAPPCLRGTTVQSQPDHGHAWQGDTHHALSRKTWLKCQKGGWGDT